MNHQMADATILVIQVKQLDRDIDTEIVMKKNWQLEILMKTYCHVFRLNLEDVRFQYKGIVVNNTDTAESLGIVNWDVIWISNAQGGPIIVLKCQLESVNEFISDRVMIRLFGLDYEHDLEFCVQTRAPINQLLSCDIFIEGCDQAHRLSYRGITIKDTDTAESLGIEDWDIIEVSFAQNAG